MAKAHILSAAAPIWKGLKDELDVKEEDEKTPYSIEAPVPAEEVKKVAKYFQHAVTKFGASAAVADGQKDPALKAVAKELLKAFTAAEGTLLSVRRGAGPSLCAELREIGGALAEAMDQLGAAVGTANMAVSAGKALDRCKHLERISISNRVAVRRRLLMSLSQLRDAGRELSEALKKQTPSQSSNKSSKAESDDDGDDFSDLDCFDEALEPEERKVVELVVAVSTALEDMLKQASTSCMPAKGGAAELTIEHLEEGAKSANAAAGAIDGMAAHAMGGLDAKAFKKSMGELRGPVDILAGIFPQSATAAATLKEALGSCEVAIDEFAKANGQDD